MKRLLMAVAAVALIVLVLRSDEVAAHPPAKQLNFQVSIGTDFTYQGRLEQDGTPVDDTCDFQFSLWDMSGGGLQIGSTQAQANVVVIGGYFTAQLDFGSDVFNGEMRWLAVAVRCPAGSGGYTNLNPRQAITAAPYALYSQTTGALQTYPVTVTAPSVGDVLKWDGTNWSPDVISGGSVYAPGYGLSLNGNVFNVVTSTIQGRISGTCSNGEAIRVVNPDGTVTCEPVNGSSAYWKLNGNTGTNATNFLGTTDSQPLELRINGSRALLLEPQSGSPNLIGGYGGNTTGNGVIGAAIGGGGQIGAVNQVDDAFGTVSGGRSNTAGGLSSAIGGGEMNNASGDFSAVSGGSSNAAIGLDSTIGGGINNAANGDWSSISGGAANSVEADYATIGGGQNNVVTDTHGTIGGGSSNSALGIYTTVSGGQYNTAANWNAAVGGGYFNVADGLMATVGGGSSNSAIGDYATVAGGVANEARTFAATVGGGNDNNATASGATVGGGQYNAATNYYASVGGGANNTASGVYAAVGGGDNILVSGQSASVAGGSTISVTADYASVGGGRLNVITASDATIGGGRNNTGSNTYTTIGGGLFNTASGSGAVVGGGSGNSALGYYTTVGGGNSLYATGYAATISGGEQDTVFGDYGTVGGGNLNHSYGDYGVVAGGNGNTVYGFADTIGGGTANYVTGTYSTIAGGRWNRVEAALGTIGGGGGNGPSDRNWVTDDGGTIGGGGSNLAGTNNGDSSDAQYTTIAGGWNNTAGNQYTTVSGGQGNNASGQFATIAGGLNNVAAGNYSFAAGCQAQANHDGSFVWADSLNCTPFASQRADQFRVRAFGGARFDDDIGNWIDMIWTQPIDTSTGAYLSWGGTWTNASDANLKENYTPIDSHAILEAVANLTIESWNYKAEDASIHHLGPTAQDFSAAFGLGNSDKAIGTIDADGVSLVSIQALYQLNQEQAAQIETLQAQNAKLGARLSALETKVNGIAPSSSSASQSGWLLGGLLVIGLVNAWRWHKRGER